MIMFFSGAAPWVFVLKYAEKIAELEKFIETRLVEMGFELVDLRLTGPDERQVLELYCDRFGDESICVDDCAQISERFKYILQAEGFFPDGFSLIVSSPGLDRVVKHPRDFAKFAGRKVKVFKSRSAGGGSVVGILAGYDDGRLKLVFDDGLDEFFEAGQYNSVRLVPELKGFEGPKEKRIKTAGK